MATKYAVSASINHPKLPGPQTLQNVVSFITAANDTHLAWKTAGWLKKRIFVLNNVANSTFTLDCS